MIKTLIHLPAFALAIGSAASLPALAQHTHGDHAAAASANATAQPAAELVTGEVRKIDLPARKITLKHGEIKSLGMPPMTMVYDLKDAATARDLKVGDPVQFRATAGAGGSYLVTELRRAR